MESYRFFLGDNFIVPPCINIIYFNNYSYIVIIYIYIIIIMSRRLRGYPWPSLAISPYHSLPPAGLQGYIPCPHTAAVCRFVLVVPLLHIHVRGSTGVHRLWDVCIYIYIYNDYIWKLKLEPVVEGDPKALFSIATTLRCRGGWYLFPWIAPLTLDSYLIMLSVNQSAIKNHFLSL